jgi:hypothetical protein
MGGRGMHGFSYLLPLSALGGTEVRAFATGSGVELSSSACRRQKAHYGRRHTVLVECDPAYAEGPRFVSRPIGYVDASYCPGASSVEGSPRLLRLFDATAERCSAMPCGRAVGEELLACLTSLPPAASSALSKFIALTLVKSRSPGRPWLPWPITPASDWVICSPGAAARPSERSRKAVSARPHGLLAALCRVSPLRSASGSDEALIRAAEGLGLAAALKGVTPATVASAPCRAGVQVVYSDYSDTDLYQNVRRSLEALSRLGTQHEHTSLRTEVLPYLALPMLAGRSSFSFRAARCSRDHPALGSQSFDWSGDQFVYVGNEEGTPGLQSELAAGGRGVDPAAIAPTRCERERPRRCML